MNEISKKLKCLVMRNGVEIWKEEDRLNDLIRILSQGNKIGFVCVDDELLNAVDIVGVFSPEAMEEMTRRKNGEWKCSYDKWHGRGVKCLCRVNTLDGSDLAKYAQG
jgi:hypothetical protein